MLTVLSDKVQRIKREGKRSYFDKRWSAGAGFDKNVDRGDYQFDEAADCSPTRELTRSILDHLQNKPDDHLRNFVGKLTKKSLVFVAQRRGMHLAELERASIIGVSSRELVDRMFVFFYQCAAQLNSSLGLAGLMINHTTPQYVTEITRYSKMRQPLESVIYYRARLASPTWSLVIRAKDDVIEVFLLPSRAVLGLSKTEIHYPPLATLHADIEDQQAVWEIDEKPLTPQRERDLCMIIFHKLLDRSMEQIVIEDDREFLLEQPHTDRQLPKEA